MNEGFQTEEQQTQKNGVDWNKHFNTVTPFSKYSAMVLFIILPFAAFWFGMKYEASKPLAYEPVILERTFEKEVIVETNSTSTEEVRIIIFSGAVKEGGRNDCVTEGKCSILVSEYEVVWNETGRDDEEVGTKDAVRPGDTVEVYGQITEKGIVSLYGSKLYHIKKVKSGEKSVAERQRGNLLILRNEGGLCSYGECWSEYRLYTDGSWDYTDGQGVFVEGEVSSQQKNDFIIEVAKTDFESVKAKEFTGTCPTASDGQKTLYTFYSELGQVDIDSCVTDISGVQLFTGALAEVLATMNSKIGG